MCKHDKAKLCKKNQCSSTSSSENEFLRPNKSVECKNRNLSMHESLDFS